MQSTIDDCLHSKVNVS